MNRDDVNGFLLGFTLTMLLLALAGSAHGATLATNTGVLATAQATTGATANDVFCENGTEALVIGIIETGTTTAAIEHSTDGTNFNGLSIEGATKISVADPTNVSIQIAPCVGKYRVNLTTCTTCSATITYIKSTPPH